MFPGGESGELRNNNARVIDAVMAGETIIVTRNGNRSPSSELSGGRSVAISAITVAELAAGPHLALTLPEAGKRQARTPAPQRRRPNRWRRPTSVVDVRVRTRRGLMTAQTSQTEQTEQLTLADLGSSPSRAGATDAGVPRGLRFVPEVIGTGLEHDVLSAIDDHRWEDSMQRQVQHYGWRYDFKSRRITGDAYLGPLPGFLHPLIEILAGSHQFRPDQAIINEYRPGQGISSHVDCEPCFGPVVAMFGLGSRAEMTFEHLGTGEGWSLHFERRGLLVLDGPSRYEWRHAIQKRKSDHGRRRGRRVSITFRSVIPPDR